MRVDGSASPRCYTADEETVYRRREMAKKEGDEDVRKLVIREIEKSCEVTLMKTGRRKWLRDDSGRNWVVLVGKGNWHAIPEDVIAHEKQQDSDRCGVICMALLKSATIDVFQGHIKNFVRAIETRNISLDSRGHYHFNYEIKGNKMIVREDYTVIMDKIVTIPYGEEERRQNMEYNQEQAKLNRILQNMSVDEIEEMLRELDHL